MRYLLLLLSFLGFITSSLWGQNNDKIVNCLKEIQVVDSMIVFQYLGKDYHLNEVDKFKFEFNVIYSDTVLYENCNSTDAIISCRKALVKKQKELYRKFYTLSDTNKIKNFVIRKIFTNTLVSVMDKIVKKPSPELIIEMKKLLTLKGYGKFEENSEYDQPFCDAMALFCRKNKITSMFSTKFLDYLEIPY